MKLKIFILLLFVITFFFKAQAQYYNLAIGPELNIPSGNSTNLSSIGLGAALKAEIGLTNKYAITVHSSLTNFYGKKYFGITTVQETSVPIKAGFKYYSSANFYLEGQIGANIPISGNAKTGFVWSPGIGSYIHLKKSYNLLDVGLRYEGWSNSREITPNNSKFSTFGFIGLRVAYALSI